MFKDIEVSFPGGENITGDKMVVNVIDSEEEKMKGAIIGSWSLEELVDSKNYLEDILETKILKKLNGEDSFIANNLKHKLAENEQKFVESLSEKEKEIYGKVFNSVKLMLEGNLPEGVQGQELESVLGEIFDEVEEVKDNQNNNNDENDNIIEFPKKKD